MPNSLEQIVVQELGEAPPQEKDIQQIFSYEYGSLRSKVLNNKRCLFEVNYCKEEDIKDELIKFFHSKRAVERYTPFLDENKSMTLAVEVRNRDTKAIQQFRFGLKYEIQKTDKYATLKEQYPQLKIFTKNDFRKVYRGDFSCLVLANSKGKLVFEHDLENKSPEEIIRTEPPDYQPVRLYHKISDKALNKIEHHVPRTIKGLEKFDTQLTKQL